jgi:hypothetical protein
VIVCPAIDRVLEADPVRKDPDMSRAETATSTGISFGSALAITISWSQWHSILWAILHGICSWFYVIYFMLTRR